MLQTEVLRSPDYMPQLGGKLQNFGGNEKVNGKNAKRLRLVKKNGGTANKPICQTTRQTSQELAANNFVSRKFIGCAPRAERQLRHDQVIKGTAPKFAKARRVSPPDSTLDLEAR